MKMSRSLKSLNKEVYQLFWTQTTACQNPKSATKSSLVAATLLKIHRFALQSLSCRLIGSPEVATPGTSKAGDGEAGTDGDEALGICTWAWPAIGASEGHYSMWRWSSCKAIGGECVLRTVPYFCRAALVQRFRLCKFASAYQSAARV